MLIPAKINLFLHVTGKLDNGYHTLESLIVPINLHDSVDITNSNILELVISGPYADISGPPQNNIALKAAHALAKEAGITHPKAKIHIKKNIPVGAGLAGGSADAAATLKLLNKFWNINFSSKRLAQIGLKLGADIPYCLISKPSMVSSIGEIVNEVTIPNLNILLINPNISLSTREVFTLSPIDLKTEKYEIDNTNFIDSLTKCQNSLKKNATTLLPVIRQILNLATQQNGCLLSRMTGSGSSCFALFNSKKSLKEAIVNISSQEPQWLVVDVSN